MTTKAEVDVDLGNIKAELDLGLDDIQADLGLDDIRADVEARASMTARADVGAKADIGARADVHAKADIGARADVGAKAEMDVRADLGLDDIQAKVGAHADLVAAIRELAPVIFQFLWKEIPIVRVAMPVRYKLGFQLLGHELASLTFCGESELLTEDHRRRGAGGGHGAP